MRRFATYLLVSAAGMGPILALPGVLQAADHGVSSIIEHELDRALDRIQQENELQALEGHYETSDAFRNANAVDWFEVKVLHSAEAPAITVSADWSELARYEEIQLESQSRQRIVQDRTPCALAPTPPLSVPGVLSADHSCPGANLSRGGALVAIQISTAGPSARGTVQAVPFTIEAIDLGLRDYYAVRNGYYGDADEAYRTMRPPLNLASPAAFVPVSSGTLIRLPLSFSSLSLACDSSFAASVFFVSVLKACPAPHVASRHRSILFGDRT